MLKLAVRRQIWWWTHDPRPLYILNRAAQTSAPLPDPKLEDSKIKSTNHLGIVATVFSSLPTENEGVSLKLPMEKFFELRTVIRKEIEAASTVNALLAISEKQITRQESLKIISLLASWATAQKVKLSEFDADPRFLNLCKILGKTHNNLTNSYSKSDDLNTVLGITGDDEAAKLISNLSIPQMIKVMSTLGQKKRRSTPLLRTLSFNISRHADIIEIKKCADLLYSMAILSFPDPVLMDRICSDIQESISQSTDKSSIIGSIVTSLGMLKYKNEKLLESMLSWMLTNFKIVRPQDIFSMVLTMATLNFNPTIPDIEKLFKLTESDLIKPNNWLDYVWSLLVLDRISEQHVSSVLNSDFIERLKIDGEIPFIYHKRLININGYATVMKGHKESLLPKEIFDQFKICYSKDKQIFVNVLLDTLKSLLSSETNLKKNCDSEMGFRFDALCVLDSKCNPYPVDSNINEKKNLTKVAMLALDYHDLCRNTMDPLGSIILYKRLLEAQKYKVLLVLYTDFNSRENLMSRVQYIENKLKEIVSENSSVSKK